MSISDDLSEIYKRSKDHIVNLKEINKRYNVDGLKKLVVTFRINKEFRSEWNNSWASIAKDEGGKISLTTAGVIIGASIGGVGIATAGSAIGLPLAFVLGIGGFLLGSEVDTVKSKLTKNRKKILIPGETYDRITVLAKELNTKEKELLDILIIYAVEEWESQL